MRRYSILHELLLIRINSILFIDRNRQHFLSTFVFERFATMNRSRVRLTVGQIWKMNFFKLVLSVTPDFRYTGIQSKRNFPSLRPGK